MSELEHVNISVADPEASARWLGEVFGWRVRWQGRTDRGLTVHCGTDASYVALWEEGADRPEGGCLNHIGVVVDDLDAVEAHVRASGLVPHHHADYEPGRRFYVFDGDGIEWEVVSYDR